MAAPLWRNLDELMDRSIHSGIILGGAAALTFVIGRLTKFFVRHATKLAKDRGSGEAAEFEKQTSTMGLVARRLLVALVWIVALSGVLHQFGFDVRPLLATAGLGALAIGFAAQNILKDLIGGFFLLAEGRIRVGDVVTINNLSGEVEELSLRNTILRGDSGELHVIANGSITQMSNLTRTFAYYVFDVSVDPEQDPDRMLVLLRGLVDELREDKEFRPLILEPLEVWGVDRFTEQGVRVKSRVKTLAGQQWRVGREVNRRLHARAAAQGLKIATAQRVQVLGGKMEDGG